jgi:hypothetical protein
MLQGCAYSFFEKEFSNIPGVFIQRAEYIHLNKDKPDTKIQLPSPLEPVPYYTQTDIESGKTIPDTVVLVMKTPNGDGTHRWRGDAWFYAHPYFFHISYSQPNDFSQFDKQRITEKWVSICSQTNKC